MIANTIDALFKYAGPAITICGAIVAWAYVSASKRLGIIDLFACEIKTLCRVGTIFDVGATSRCTKINSTLRRIARGPEVSGSSTKPTSTYDG